MIVSTTTAIDGSPVSEYVGVVTGEMVAEAEQLGADAVIGVDVDYESIQVGQGGSMLMVSASGTAVKL